MALWRLVFGIGSIGVGTMFCQFVGSGANPLPVIMTVYQGSAQVVAAQSRMNSGPAVPEVGDQAVLAGGALYVRSVNRLFSVRVLPVHRHQCCRQSHRPIVVPCLVSAAPPAGGTARP